MGLRVFLTRVGVLNILSFRDILDGGRKYTLRYKGS
jgi:hypothetical protein